MTCVAFCQLESLFWFVWTFCYCFNFIINIVYVWQWASCQPQCPPSQFHCPLCNHMGALQHFSTLFELTEPGMHCEEQHKVEATLPESPLDVCLWWIFISAFYSGTCDHRINVVLVCLRSIFTSSTTLWLFKAGKNGTFSCSLTKRYKRNRGETLRLNKKIPIVKPHFSVAQFGNGTNSQEKHL